MRTTPPLRLARPRPGVLVLTKSRMRHLVEFVAPLVAVLGFFVVAFGVPNSPADLVERVRAATSQQPFLWLMLLAMLFFIVRRAGSARVLLRGESFTFDGNRGLLLRNDDQIARFDQIAAVNIRTIGGESPEYRLSVDLHDGTKISIDQGGDLDGVSGIADAIADVTRKSVTRKN